MQNGLRFLMTYVAFAVVAYLCIVIVMYVSQRNLMYHPDKNLGRPLDSGLPEMVAVNLTNSEGMKIVSWYKSASTNKPTLVYFHGNAGNIGDRHDKVRPLLDHGIGVILVGYRGYGNNPGNPTEEGLYADASLALDFLSRTGIMPDHWVLYGESLGTAVAVEMAQRLSTVSPVAATILEAPFTSMADAAKSHYPWLPVGILLKDRYDSIAKIKSINTSLMVLHGTGDRVVPMQLGQKLYDAAVTPKTDHWIDGAGHDDLFDHDGGKLTIEFIEKIWAEHTS